MNIEQARFNMIEQQIRSWKPLDANTLELLHVVQRENFVLPHLRQLAFADSALPIGHDAVMFEPKLEALAISSLAIKSHENILEIGTGSGFMAALLAAHAEQVWSLEIVPELAAMARTNLQKSGVDNVVVETMDGLAGLPAHAPYDAIMVSGGLTALPQALLEQLKVGGRLFAIIGTAPAMQVRLVTRVSEEAFNTVTLCETVVPLLKNAVVPAAFVF